MNTRETSPVLRNSDRKREISSCVSSN